MPREAEGTGVRARTSFRDKFRGLDNMSPSRESGRTKGPDEARVGLGQGLRPAARESSGCRRRGWKEDRAGTTRSPVLGDRAFVPLIAVEGGRNGRDS